MKRIVCMILAICFAVMVGIPSVSAETEGPFHYYVFDGKAEISKCDQSVEGHLDIPETLGGYPVVAIWNQAFMGCLNLTSVTIPSTIHSLQGSAFWFCGLTTVTIPKTVTTIGDSAFEECSSLTEIIVEEGNPYYTSVDGVLFSKNLTKLMQYPGGKTDAFYSIPHGVEIIDDWAFAVNPYLKEVVISDTVALVGEFAFHFCENLIDVTVPSSVIQIDRLAFGLTYDKEAEAYIPIQNFTIHGYVGTVAERYCMEYADYGFSFDLLNQKGDGNGDNEINAKDALIALKLSVEKITSTPGYVQVIDVNGDTLVNAKDALEILKKSVGKPACF